MKVIVAENCGFCPGVKNAISMAEDILEKRDEVYSLGPIIHNKDMVEKLYYSGLKTVEDLDSIQSGTVLIRSHGASPDVIEKINAKNLEIADATCVLVKRVQKIASQLAQQGYEVVIIGDENHPEVQAVVGCAGKNVAVIGDEGDLDRLPENSRLGVVCQTTKGPELFRNMLCAISQRNFRELRAINTLCKETIKRQESAVDICKKVNIMFVLGGLDSANTRTLADLCKKYNKETFHLQNWRECDKNMLFNKTVAGVTAGASTPEWIIEEFVENLRNFEQ